MLTGENPILRYRTHCGTTQKRSSAGAYINLIYLSQVEIGKAGQCP